MNVRSLFRWFWPKPVSPELEQQIDLVRRQSETMVGELDRIAERENPLTGERDPLANLVHAMRNEQLRRGFTPESGNGKNE